MSTERGELASLRHRLEELAKKYNGDYYLQQASNAIDAILAEHPQAPVIQPMAEVIRRELSMGSYQMPGETLPYEMHAAKIAEALAAAGCGRLGLEGGIWTMTDAEFKTELAEARAEGAAAVANAVRGPLINLVNALEFTATETASETVTDG